MPLALLNAQPVPGQTIGGEMAANLQFSQNFQQMRGQVDVAKPRWGAFVGDRLTTGVTLANGVLALQDGLLSRRNSQYQFQGKLNTSEAAGFAGQIATNNGQVQDLLPLLRSLGVKPNPSAPITYAKANAVVPQPMGNPNASVADQLKLIAEIDLQLDKPSTQRSRAELSLDQLQGPFMGQVNFAGNRQRLTSAQFDLRADQLTMEQTQLNRAIIQGELRDGITEIKALGLDVEGGSLQFKGRLGETRQQGMLTVANLPMTFIRRFVDVPNLELDGKVQGQANLNGTFTNPKLQGQLQLLNGTLNQQPLRAATSQFNYDQGRLEFNSTAQFDNSEPVQIVGSLPVDLPFGQRAASNQRISLDMSVRDAGLSLMRLFTDQIAWDGGNGVVNLQVRGTLNQPTVNGLISLNQATISSPLLSQPLTAVTGTMRFNQDRLRVEQLTGQYQAGQVTAVGVLPINSPFATTDPDRKRPLQVSLAPLDTRIPNLYNGKMEGQIVVLGTALAPVLGGNVELSNGQISLEHLSQTEAATNGFTNGITNNLTIGQTLLLNSPPTRRGQGSQVSSVQLQQLRVRLGDNVKISRSPLFSFVGTGNITVNGPISQPQPDGVVEFRSGQVNLFTSRFRLAPGYSQLARFTPSQGLDPTLDLTLLTTASEVFGTRTNRLDEFDTLPLATLGSLTSVRVQAKITGRASRLEQDFKNNVELTSTPARSQDEILALLGGLGRTTGRNDPTLALVNIAGAALFNRVQGFVNNYLGNRTTFRLFPTLIPLDLSRPSNGSVLGLGAELGYDLTRQLSVSATQVLTAPENPTQFNLGYQFNDRWRFSTSIDIEGQATGLLEYRVRF
jgi:translocation and assembly module TamB